MALRARFVTHCEPVRVEADHKSPRRPNSKLLEQLGNVNRCVALVNTSVSAILQLLSHERAGGQEVPREELQSIGRNMIDLAGVLSDMGVEMAGNIDVTAKGGR